MTVKAQLFDGTVLEFPDGTDPQVIARVAKEKTAERRQSVPRAGDMATDAATGAPVAQLPPRADAPASPSAPATAGSNDSAILDAISSVPSGMLKGTANILGFIPDLGILGVNNAPRLANMIPGVDGVGPLTDDPATVTDGLNQVFQGFGAVPYYKPTTSTGKFTNRVSEEVGAMLTPGAAAIKIAERMGKPAINAMRGFDWNKPATYLSALAKSYLRPAAANPSKFLGQEALIGTGAGLGAASTNLVMGNEDRERLGPDITGAVGGATLTGVAKAILPRLADMFAVATANAKYASGYVKEGVAAQIASNSDILARQNSADTLQNPLDTDALVAKLRTTPDILDAVPNYRPTTAEVAGDTSLLNLENARSGADNAQLFRTRRDENVNSVEEALAPSRPNEPSSRFTQELGLERDRQLTDADLASLLAGRDADSLTQPLATTSTRPERGDAIREGILREREIARQRTGDAYAASGAGATPADPVAVRARIDAAVDGLTEVRKGLLPEATIERVRRLGADGGGGPVPTGVLDANGNPIMRPAPPPAPIQLEEVMSLRSELQRLERAALQDPRAENGGRNAAEAIRRVTAALDGYIDDVLPPDQKLLLDESRAAKFDEVEAFGRQGDPLAAATATYPGGNPRMRDSRVASTFTDPQNIDTLFAQAPTPQVRTAVKEEILSRGDFSTAAGATQFKTEYAEQLKRFPGLTAEIEKAVQARVAAETARGDAAALGKDIGPEGVGTVAKYLRYGDERAERAMERVMNQPDAIAQVDELLRFVNDDPKSVEGARKAFWEVMERKGRSGNAADATASGTMPWATGKWKKFMEDRGFRGVAERLYRNNPEHWANIQKIEGALRQLGERRGAVIAQNPSKTESSRRGAAVSLAEVQSKYYEVARGRVSPIYMLTYLGTRIANRAIGAQSQKAFTRLLDEALIDPDVAARLLSDYNPANRAALRRWAKGWIGNNGANLIDGLFDDDSEDPVVEAVTGGR